MTSRGRLALAVMTLALGACAGQAERVVLLPQEGRPTSLVVTGPDGSQATLGEPYAEAVVTARQTTVGKIDAATVGRRYGSVIEATPVAAKSFVVYFLSGGNELVKEAAGQLAAIVTELAGIPAGEVIVIGHTDRVGTVEANDALSLRRAQMVRERLIAAGVAAESVAAVGRGEREPAVDTADEVAEPRNRRVEIKLR